jgi:transcriptional regulator with XRE-family HTH domain
MTDKEINSFYTLIGDSIKSARIKSGVKQEYLAHLLNLSRASVVNIEKARQRPSIHLLWEVSKILKIEITSLLPSDKEKLESVHDFEKQISVIDETNEIKSKLLDFIREEVKELKKTYPDVKQKD